MQALEATREVSTRGSTMVCMSPIDNHLTTISYYYKVLLAWVHVSFFSPTNNLGLLSLTLWLFEPIFYFIIIIWTGKNEAEICVKAAIITTWSTSHGVAAKQKVTLQLPPCKPPLCFCQSGATRATVQWLKFKFIHQHECGFFVFFASVWEKRRGTIQFTEHFTTKEN